MDIRLHIGVHRTATKHLQQCLTENKDLIESQGICLPDRRPAEKALRIATKSLADGSALADVQAELVETLTLGRLCDRIVISNETFSGNISRPFGKELFYPRVGEFITRMVRLFEGMNLRIFVSIRNPATFIMSSYTEMIRTVERMPFENYISETNLQGLKWSSFLHRAQTKSGELPITVWRFEDYPYMWRDVIQAMTGISNKEVLTGSNEKLNQGISYRGAQLLDRYLKEHPPGRWRETRKILTAFDERFPSEPHENFGLEWPDELIEGLTENYEDDWYYIERMDHLETIQPKTYL